MLVEVLSLGKGDSIIEKIANNPKLSKRILDIGGKMLNKMITKYAIIDIRWGVDANNPNDSVVIKITCGKPAEMIRDIDKFSVDVQKSIQEKNKAN